MFTCDHCGKKLKIQPDGESHPTIEVVDKKINFIVHINVVDYDSGFDPLLCLSCEKRIVMKHWKANRKNY